MRINLVALFIVSFALSPITNASVATDNFAEIISYRYLFSKVDNFKTEFADYLAGEEMFYQLHIQQKARLPFEIKPRIYGLKISGKNHSDDLFMYTYKKLGGLKANTRYKVQFSLEFASNFPAGGRTSGLSIFVKAGAVSEKPERYIDVNGYYRMKLDKGYKNEDGKDMITLGTAGVDTANSMYRLKTLPYLPSTELRAKMNDYIATTNEQGQIWLIVGTDSTIANKATIYYTSISAIFKEVS